MKVSDQEPVMDITDVLGWPCHGHSRNIGMRPLPVLIQIPNNKAMSVDVMGSLSLQSPCSKQDCSTTMINHLDLDTEGFHLLKTIVDGHTVTSNEKFTGFIIWDSTSQEFKDHPHFGFFCLFVTNYQGQNEMSYWYG